ncbi:hypothetical protein N7493_008527 [Penicillium malachiteum]|uniref:Uncharacterized protein n=1 Tax=Penicillium malachiteum TaxID=1324776 RepID=A0AAD6HHE8_9EURO|nr:hypothetical protein N7493_008527 [Penicillium malachiteum]
MPITFATAAHSPRKWRGKNVSTAEELLARSSSQDKRRSQNLKMIQSSFPQSSFGDSHITASRNGFVWSIFEAYNHHHNLIIRPEDVWFSILTQLSFYVNAHSEELRSFFVAHEGQKELKVFTVGTIDSIDFGDMAIYMTDQIEKNILVEDLRTWIMPNFSTSIETDNVVAAILMMGSMQKYFSYRVMSMCGIPSVTLLGEREDWHKLTEKLDKLYQLGDEPARFAQLLCPILNNFVDCFDNPGSPSVIDFWSRCAHNDSMGSGSDYLCGWASVFCFWSGDGDLVYPEPIYPVSSQEFEAHSSSGLKDALSRRIDTVCIPSGIVSVPVTVNDNGVIHHTIMLAGLLGIQATSSGVMLDGKSGHEGDISYQMISEYPFEFEEIPYTISPATEEAGLDSIQPVSGWMMYEKRATGQEQGHPHEVERLRDHDLGEFSFPIDSGLEVLVGNE